MTTHQTHHAGRPYVRLTFRAGARARTIWAIQESPTVFRRASPDGGVWQESVCRGDVETVTEEMIVVRPDDDHMVVPAGVSLHYGRLEAL